jgi:hypothetical protein
MAGHEKDACVALIAGRPGILPLTPQAGPFRIKLTCDNGALLGCHARDRGYSDA